MGNNKKITIGGFRRYINIKFNKQLTTKRTQIPHA
jgi:hypothetical protein